MKKVLGLSLLLTLGSISHVNAAGCLAQAGVVKVTSTGACSSIQDAIDLADGVQPLVIDVLPGTYAAPLIGKSNIHIRGSGAGKSIITSIDLSYVNDIIISGFTFSDGYVWVNDSSLVLTDNLFINGTNVHARNTDLVFTGNKQIGGYGIDTEGPRAIITDNTFIDLFDYIWLGDGGLDKPADHLVANNVFEGGDYGAIAPYLSSAESTVTVEGNVISGASDWGGAILVPMGEGSVNILNNTITANNGSGIEMYYNCKDLTIANNVITKNNSSGILLDSREGVMLLNNQITDNGVTTGDADIVITSSNSVTPANISFNVYDSINNTGGLPPVGAFNIKANGTPW